LQYELQSCSHEINGTVYAIASTIKEDISEDINEDDNKCT